MRVLHVIDSLGSGGTETSLRELLPALHNDRLQHAVATFAPGEQAPPQFADIGIRVLAPDYVLRGRIARTQHVRSAISEFRPDLLHTALFEADLAGRIAGSLSRTPVLTSLVNMSYVREAWPSGRLPRIKFRAVKAIDSLLGRRATYAFHAVTHSVASQMVSDLGIERRRVWVVPRGRSLARLGEPSPERRKAVRAELGVDPGAPLLLNVGRHEPQKGQVDLVAVVALLQQAHTEVQLLIAGREGRSSSELRRRMEQTAVSDRVHLLGSRDDIGDLLCAADLFVFPSRYEGIGGAMLEAMIMGVPVVASDIPGLREVLDDGRCGVLVTPGDPGAFADAIDRTISDPQEAANRAAEARRRALHTYSYQACVQGMEAMYLDLQEDIVRDARRVRPKHRAS